MYAYIRCKCWVFLLTFDVQVHFVAADGALRVHRSAHVLAVGGLRDALQHQRLVGDDNAARREQLVLLLVANICGAESIPK